MKVDVTVSCKYLTKNGDCYESPRGKELCYRCCFLCGDKKRNECASSCGIFGFANIKPNLSTIRPIREK